MENLDLVPLEEFCTHYRVETSFITSLHESGLVHVTTVEERCYLPVEELSDIEKYIRWHYEMDINLEGIEAISHLLERIRQLQNEITSLRRSTAGR